MRWGQIGLLAVLLCTVLGGCQRVPFARELEDTALVQVLGVDFGEEEVTLTAAADLREGGQTNGKNAVISASGTSLGQAKRILEGTGEEYVALTHVAQVVIGADTELWEVLAAVVEEPALGQSACVWLVREGTAREMLEGANGGVKRLSAIQLNTDVPTVTVLEALMQMQEGRRVAVPVLTLEGDKLEAPAVRVFGGASDGT